MLGQSRRIVNSVFFKNVIFNFSKSQLINVPQSKYADHRQQLLKNGWRDTDPTYKKSQKTHLSQAQYLIHKIPVIYGHQSVVRCIGGTQINAGHPQVYIQLNTRTPGQPVSCKYCGLRYALDTHHHH